MSQYKMTQATVQIEAGRELSKLVRPLTLKIVCRRPAMRQPNPSAKLRTAFISLLSVVVR